MAYTIIPDFISASKYLHSATLLVFFFIVAKLVLWIIEKYVVALTKKTKTDIDDKLVKQVDKPLSILIFLGGVRLAMLPLQLGETIYGYIHKSIVTLMAFVIAVTLFGISNIVLGHWDQIAKNTASKLDDQLIMMLRRVAKLLIVILTLLVILRVWEIEIGPLLASLGIAGVAVAFALQQTLGNVFGGISMILDRSIKVGDIVKLESGEIGTVYDVGLRATRIKSFDNEIIIIPNGQLANGKIENYVLPDPSIRVNVEFGVQYGADPEFVKHLAVEEVKKIKDVQREPAPWILFKEMGDSSLNFKIMFWVDDISKKWATHQEAITRIYRRLYKESIGIPFPQRTVWTYNAGKAPNPSPYDKKYKKFYDKHNITLAKKSDQKNPEEQTADKLKKKTEKEVQKEKKQ